MTDTSDEGYESWMDEAGLSDESAHPSDMPNKADTASKRSRESPQYFDENPRNTFDKCTEQQLCTPQGFQRFAGFLCDTTEYNSENGYTTSDKHTVPYAALH